MKEYKVYQLLKLKKKLIGEIINLTNKIATNNSRIEGAKINYNVDELFSLYLKKKEDLVLVKKTIQKNTTPIYEKIFNIEENKDTISFLKGLSTREGLQLKRTSFGEESTQIINVCTINELRVDSLVKHYELEIEKLQGEIDEYNYTTVVNLDLKV